MTKHTQGPWTGIETISGPDGQAICDVVSRDTLTPNASINRICANARLIRAAPELFEVVKQIYDYLLSDPRYQVADQVRLADLIQRVETDE